MRYLITATFALLALAGCANDYHEYAEDEARCASWGITQSDSRYAQCRTQLAQQHAADQLAADTATAQRGRGR
jgi:hypothetical protein